MRLNEILIAAVVEGDFEAENLATELIGNMKVVDLTESQVTRLVNIKKRWDSEDEVTS